MIISAINNYYSFKSKNKEIKLADKIQRQARREFPAYSPTYTELFYKNRSAELESHKESFYNILENARCKQYIDLCRIDKERDITRFDEYETTLRRTKKTKVANCYEYAIMAIAGLIANGYDGSRGGIGYQIDILDKNTHEVLKRSKTKIIDHTFALTTMNNPKRKEDKDKIIIDPLFGFTDSYSKSIAKYKQIYADELKKFDEKETEEFDKDKITIQRHFVLDKESPMKKEEIENIKELVEEEYPKLKLQ